MQRLALHARATWVALSFACACAQGATFGFDDVAREAQALAQTPFAKAAPLDPQRALLDYDAYRRIQFRAQHALWRGQGTPFEMHFFPVGGYHTRALRLHEIVDGKARPLALPASVFDNDGVLPTEPAEARAQVAGWKLTFPLNDPSKRDEVISFLGASYFRALGQQQRYGLSARAVAVDTVGAAKEEFPAFVACWFETPRPAAREFVFYALLDGPRITGAYRFVLRPDKTTTVDVRARLFARAGTPPIATFGVAPLTSMFLHAENQPATNGDFRPEVHDSDGLQIHSADGEWIWRPLTNPAAPFVTSFALRSPRGFGLMQRDRAFASYEDVEARYDLRPSAWVEPFGDWGPGRVELLQFRTPDETHDNIAAYWVPAVVPKPGAPVELAWRVHWQGTDPIGPSGARVLQTRSGHGYSKLPVARERRKLVIDFAGPGLPQGAAAEAAADADAPMPVQAVASVSSNARLVRVHAYPNPGRAGWRATVEFDRLDPKQAVELRVFLRQGPNTLSETWSYALPPD